VSRVFVGGASEERKRRGVNGGVAGGLELEGLLLLAWARSAGQKLKAKPSFDRKNLCRVDIHLHPVPVLAV